MVEVLVLPNGDGRISNGVHHPKLGDEYYDAGERFSTTVSNAFALEARGLVVRTSLLERPEHIAAVKTTQKAV
jgi:hypothetical protein